MADMTKKYPGVFPTEKQDLANQQKLIDHAWTPKVMQERCEAYNAAYQNLWDNWGFDKKEFGRYERGPMLLKHYLKTLDYDYIMEMKPSPTAMKTEDWQTMDSKMKNAAEMVSSLNENLKVDLESLPEAAKMLQKVKIDKSKAKLKEWIQRILYMDDEDKTWSGLPFDSAMMERVLMDIRTEKTKDWLTLTPAEKDKRTAEIVDETWDTMFDKVVKFTQPDRTRKEYDALLKMYFETLDPSDQWFCHKHPLSKILFLQAYWNGGDKNVLAIDEAGKKLVEMYNTMPADITELFKETMKTEPNLTLSGEISLFIKALEPCFVTKILNQARQSYANVLFVRCAHQVMKTVHDHDFQLQMDYFNKALSTMPDVESVKADLREQMFEFAHMVDDLVLYQNVLAERKEEWSRVHAAKSDMPVPTMEEIIKTLATEALWVQENDPRAADVEAFVQELTAYAKTGKGNVVQLEDKAKSLFPSSLVSKDKPIDDLEYCRTFVTYNRATRKRMDCWSLKDAMEADTAKQIEKINVKREIVAQLLKGSVPDELLRLVKHLIESHSVRHFETIIADYSTIVKRHKGEVYGSVVSASEMTDKEFDEIVAVLQKQNPGKKYFLNRSVDTSLLGGFIIKCGTDRLDYSLASQTTALRKKLAF